MPRFKRFLNEDGGMPLDNIWTDIPAIGAHSDERLGYPTQKPEALYEKIINTYTHPNMIVLDNFSGSGVNAIACLKTKRKFICIEKDPTYYSASLNRLEKASCSLFD